MSHHSSSMGRSSRCSTCTIEALDWKHGVFLAAQLKSRTTAAAEHTGKQIMHDPFAMRYDRKKHLQKRHFLFRISRPFVGYNFGHYIHFMTKHDILKTK